MYFTTTRRKTRKDRIHIQFFAQALKKDLSQEIINRDYPLSNISYKSDITGKLQVDITLNNNQPITFSTETG